MNARFVLVLLAALLLGCSALPGSTGSPAPSPSAAPGTATSVPPTDAPAPSPTPSAAATSALPPPVATLKLPANVRAGPGTSYSIIGKCKTGSRYVVLGKSPDSKWWQIQFENRLAWIPADFTDVQGGTNSVAVVSVAPAATATLIPSPAPVRGTVISQPTATPLPPPSGRIYFIVRGQAAWVKPTALDQIYEDAALGTPGDLNQSLYTNASPLDWSPKAGKLAYVLGKQQDTLRVHDAATERVLDSHGAIVTPRWFGGGKQLAYIGYDSNFQNQALYVINADGTKPGNYRCFAARSGEQLRGLTVNRRTGDIVFVSSYTGKFELWKMDGTCSGLVQLTHDNADDSAPAFSPDGTRIAYVSNRSAPTDYQIYIMNADGTSPAALGEGFAPAFSPDGLYLAFARNLEVYIMDIGGRVEMPLTPGDRPAWAP